MIDNIKLMQEFGYEIPKHTIGIGSPINFLTPSDKVINKACSIWGVTKSEILNDNRGFKYSFPRQAIAYVLVYIFGMSTPQAGKKLKRDHTTIILSCRKVSQRTKINNDYEIKVSKLISYAKNLKEEVAK